MKRVIILGLVLMVLISSGCATETAEPVEPVKKTQVVVETETASKATSPPATQPPATPAPIETPKELAYLDFGLMTTMGFDNWDADAENDGIVATIYPHSNDGGDVKVDGVITFTLYQKVTDINENTMKLEEKFSKLQEWETAITSEEGGLMGIERKLELDSQTEALVDSEPFFIGELRAKLLTSDGKTFEAKTDVLGT